MTPDLIAGIREILLGRTEVTDLTSEIYGGELPDDVINLMPQRTILLTYSGGAGTFGGGYQEYGDRRIDVICYAPTVYGAVQLHDTVQPILKQLRRQKAANTLIHWAIQAGGPLPGRDPDGDWPFCFSSWQIMAAETAVA